jgi:hypothetical protein
MHIMEIDALMRARFENGRNPRSTAYKEGFRAGLDRSAGFVAQANPYAPATPHHDAFFAGCDAGRVAWIVADARAADPSLLATADSGEPA